MKKTFLFTTVIALVLGVLFAVSASADSGTEYVAKAGTTSYATFEDAASAAMSSGQTLTLLKDTAMADSLDLTGNLKIDLAGHMLYRNGNAFSIDRASTSLWIWSSTAGGRVITNGYLVSGGSNASSSNVYLGAYAGTTTATAAYRGNLDVQCNALLSAGAAPGYTPSLAIKIDGGTYRKTGGGKTVKHSGYAWIFTMRYTVNLTAVNADFDFFAGSIFGNQNVGSTLSASFSKCSLTASGTVYLFAGTSTGFAATLSFSACDVDGLKFESNTAKATCTIGSGCRINTPTDISSISSTAKTFVSADDGVSETVLSLSSCARVRASSAYEYTFGVTTSPTVKFYAADGTTVLSSEKWLTGEIPAYSGTPETKTVAGLTCTYGYVGIVPTKSKTTASYYPTLVNFGIPFLGKLSIDSNLHFTVYVPAKAAEAGDLALNGELLAVPNATVYLRGSAYYAFELLIAPKDALNRQTFTYTVGGESFTTEISLYKYLSKLITSDTAEISEKRLAYAVLSFVSENVAKDNKDAYATAVNKYAAAMLEARSYYSVAGTLDLSGVTSVTATSVIKGAAFGLEEETALLIYLSPSYVGDLTVSYTDKDGAAHTLTVANTTFGYTNDGGKNYLVARVALPIRDYLCNLTVTCGTESITYNLYTYLYGIQTNNGEIPAYVLSFYNYVKAANLYTVSTPLSEEALLDAYGTPLPVWSSGGQSGTGYFNPGSALLAVAINEHRNQIGGRDCKYIVERLKWYVNGFGNEPDMDLAPSWVFAQISMGIAVARQTPTVWNALDDDTKERLDFFMSCFACISSYGTDDDNNFLSGPGGKGNYYKASANYLFANATPIVAATVYFGSANAVNTILHNFDYDTYVAKLKEYNFVNVLNAWTAMGDYSRIAMNNTADLHHSYMHPKDGSGSFIQDEVVIAYNHQNRSETHSSINGGGYGVLRTTKAGYTYGGVGLDDLVGIYNQIVVNCYNGGKVVSDSSTVNNGLYTTSGTDNGYAYTAGTPKAFIVDGTKSPYEGMEGLMTEFASGDANGLRSSTAYCDHDFVMSVGSMAALYELGIWLPEENAELYAKVKVGNSDLIYKLIHGYHSYSKGTYEGDSYESSYAGYYMMKSLWYTLLGGEEVK